MLGPVAARKQAAMHLGVKRFDPAVKHLGETRELGDLGHGQPFLGQQFGGAAR